MVLDKLEDQKSGKSDKDQGSNKKVHTPAKIFTCQEIEAKSLKRNLQKSSSPSTKVLNLKRVDSAVMHYSTKTSVARYDKRELMMLKESRTAQSPPPAFYDPRIIRLNILKLSFNEQTQPKDYDIQMKEFREMLPNLSQNWDPKLLELLNNYHRSLLYPNYNYMDNDYNNRSPRQINQNFNRRVSWGDQKQFLESQCEKVPSYNRKNFFDNITTTTTMRPPQMGVGSFGMKNRQAQPQQSRNSNGNSRANDSYGYYSNSSSTGSMNETKSSYDGFSEKAESEMSHPNDITKSSNGDMEKEPEWFSCPVSRSDVIDLHGFDDDESLYESSATKDDKKRNNQNVMVLDETINNKRMESVPQVASSAFRRSNYNQPSRIMQPDNFYNQNSMNGHPKYRNPLHHSKSNMSFANVQSFNDAAEINPFFDMWKRQNAILLKCNTGGSMVTISEVENALKQQNRNPYTIGSQINVPRTSSTGNQPHQTVPQFFQNAVNSANASSGTSFNPYAAPPAASLPVGSHLFGLENFQPRNIPTKEQLQQHTSEIMRSAMMRKQSQDERKFRK